eukprot:361382-Chlamydomonas_euryale.AAC.4
MKEIHWRGLTRSCLVADGPSASVRPGSHPRHRCGPGAKPAPPTPRRPPSLLPPRARADVAAPPRASRCAFRAKECGRVPETS